VTYTFNLIPGKLYTVSLDYIRTYLPSRQAYYLFSLYQGTSSKQETWSYDPHRVFPGEPLLFIKNSETHSLFLHGAELIKTKKDVELGTNPPGRRPLRRRFMEWEP
jgi:hypothetical protein